MSINILTIMPMNVFRSSHVIKYHLTSLYNYSCMNGSAVQGPEGPDALKATDHPDEFWSGRQ